MSKKSSLILKCIFTLLITISVLCLSASSVFAQDITYEIKDISMTLNVPDNMNVITVDTAQDDLVFSTLGLDYQETMDSFAQGDIYLQAVDTEKFLTLTVTMTSSDESQQADNYNSLSKSELNQVKKGFLENEAYKSCEIKEYNGCTYLCLMLKTKTDGETIQSQQYNTVANGHNYVVSLQASNGKKLTADDKALFDKIMQSVEIQEETFFTLYGSTVLIIAVSALSFVGIIVLFVVLYKYFTNPVRKNKNLIHQLAHEHKITETTQIPRKKLHKYMLENAPKETDFMEEYSPFDELGAVKEKQSFEQIATPAGKTVNNGEAVITETVSNTEESNSSEEAVVVQENQEFDGGTDYFADVPDENEMYLYSDVDSAVDDYNLAKKAEERRRRREVQETENQEPVALKILKAIGKGLVAVFQTIFVVICYLAVHIKYFSINLYRLIKRKRAEKKRRKIQEEKRLRAEERRRQQREAEMRRRRENANRGENDLVKVRSRSEGRTYPRSGYNRDYVRNTRRR